MSGTGVNMCDFAIERYRNIARWRNMWTILLFIFGGTVIIFLCAAILLLIRQNWLPGAVSTLVTIVNSVGINWVLQRRTDAVKEEDEAYNDVQARCEGAASRGVSIGGAPVDGGDKDVMVQLKQFQEKQKLFGMIR
jgi:hypothetical protein